jgi:DNA polymerase III subunit alpha
LTRAASNAQDRARGQASLFAMMPEPTAPQFEAAARLPEWPQSDLLAAEKELLGFYVTGHPLTPYAHILEKYMLSNSATAAQLPSRSLTRLGGLVTAVQQGISKRTGKPYALATLEDLHGPFQLLAMNENYDKHRELLVAGRALLIVGEVNAEETLKIFPQEIMPLEDAPRKYARQVHLRLYTAHLSPEQLEKIRQLVLRHPGKCPLFLCLIRPGGEIVFVETHERFCVLPSSELQQEAEALLGEETFYVKVDTALPEKTQRRWERKAEPVEAA